MTHRENYMMSLSVRFVGIMAVACFSLCGESAWCQEKRDKPEPERINIELTRYAIAPYIAGGFLMGKASELIETGHRAVYGGGIRVERLMHPKLRVGVRLEAMFATLTDEAGGGRAISYSADVMILMSPETRSSFLMRGELGRAALKATDIDRGAGSYFFVKFGLGQSYFGSSRNATRFEFFYKIIFTGDYDGVSIPGQDVDFNTTYFGLQVSYAFGVSPLK